MSDIDYNTEYKTFMRCIKCNRTTSGEEDYKTIYKSGKVKTCRTCNRCRSSVKKCLIRNKKPTLKEKLNIYIKLFSLMNDEEKDNLINKLDEQDKNLIKNII